MSAMDATREVEMSKTMRPFEMGALAKPDAIILPQFVIYALGGLRRGFAE